MKISHESMEKAILSEISKRFKQYRIDYPGRKIAGISRDNCKI